MEESVKDTEILTLEVDQTLKKQLGFMGILYQIFGVLTIVSGAMMCIGIITAIAGVPYIMAGLKMFKSGSSFSETVRNNEGNSLKNALSELAKAMKLGLIAMIVFFVMYFILIMVLVSIGIFAGSQGY